MKEQLNKSSPSSPGLLSDSYQYQVLRTHLLCDSNGKYGLIPSPKRSVRLYQLMPFKLTTKSLFLVVPTAKGKLM